MRNIWQGVGQLTAAQHRIEGEALARKNASFKIIKERSSKLAPPSLAGGGSTHTFLEPRGPPCGLKTDTAMLPVANR